MEADANTEQTHERFVEWTSWEGHNFVLKGLVDELIALGANPKLKVIALQLWVKYLGKLEVAFTSTTERHVPKFGLSQTAKDYSIIRNYMNARKDDLKRKLADKKSELDTVLQDSTSTKKKKLKLGKNVITNYEILELELADSQNAINEIEDRISMLRGSVGSKNHSKNTANPDVGTTNKIQYNNKAKIILSKMLLEDNSNKSDSETNQQMTYRYSKFSSCYDPMYLTRQKVLALLCLALMLTKGEIQISDILRWINEGHLSYFNITRLIPDGVMVSSDDIAFIRNTPKLRYKSLQQCVYNIAELLGIKEFPAPNLVALTHRFLQELQLPTELANYVEKLMVSCQVHKCEGMMSYEATVMAFVIVVLKTLFGLDGKTEHRISDFASEINRLLETDVNEEVRLLPKLFVWNDWVSYINCRKSIIIDKHFPSKDRYPIEGNLATDSAPYVYYCIKERTQNQHIDSKKICRESRNAAHKKRMAKMKDVIMELPTVKNETYTYEFTPSLTPYLSYMTTVLSCQNAKMNGSNRKTFRKLLYNHTTTDIDYLIHPRRIIKLARERGVCVDVENSSSSQDVSYVPFHIVRSLVRPTTGDAFIDIINKTDGVFRHGCLHPTPNGNSSDSRKVPSSVSGKGEHTSHRQDDGRQEKHIYASEVDSTKLTLFLPFSSYWVYEISSRQAESSFETVIEKQFSGTFRWLLNECCRMLEMKSIELYTQIRMVEQLCFGKATVSSLKLHCFEKSL